MIARMDEDGLRVGPEAYLTAIDACDEDPAQALDVMKLMTANRVPPNELVYRKVMEQCAAGGLDDDAWNLYLESKKLGFIQVWVDRGRSIDLREFSDEVAAMITRVETTLKVRGPGGRGGSRRVASMSSQARP